MSDLRYKLIVDMSTTGSLAPQLEKIGKSGGDLTGAFSKISGMVGGIASGMAGAFTGAVEAAAGVAASLAKVGAVAAGGAIAYGVVGLNNELEQTRTSLGAIFNAQLGGGMTTNLELASSTIKDMRKDAAMLPGEFKDLLGFMRLGATPGLAAGASVQQMEKLSANAMAAAAATGIDQATASREFAMLLQGRAGAHNVFGSMLGFTGDKAQTFNASSGSEKIGSVEKALEKYQPAIEEFGKTFDALKSTMVDNAKNTLRTATSGVFDHVKFAMSDANKWFDAHEDKVTAFAEKVGDKLVYAFEWGRMKISEWTPAVVSFAENAYAEVQSIWTRIGPTLEKVGEGLKKALADPATFDRIEGLLKLYAAVKVGGMIAPAAGGMFSGLTGIAGTGAGGAAELSALGAAAGPAALAVAALGFTAYGVFDVLTDTSNRFHDFAMNQVSQGKEHLDSIGKNIEKSGVIGVFKLAADSVGAFALLMGNSMLLQLDVLSGWFAKATTAVGDFYRKINDLLGLKNPPPEDHHKKIGDAGWHDTKEVVRAVKDEDGKSATTRSVAGGGGTSIQKVEIVVTSNQDPDRIARLTVDRLAELGRNPTSSRFAPRPLSGR